jgi:hypothetical protein
MSELTLLQKAMRIVEEHEPSLFDVHTNKGRDFIRAMSELITEKETEIELERKSYDDIMNDLIEVSNTVIWVEEKGGEP